MSEENNTPARKQKTPEWQKYAFILLDKWYYLLVGLIIGFSVGYLKNRYSVDVYNITAQVINKKGDNDNSLSMSRGSLSFKKSNDVKREKASLLSEANISKALSKLDFSVSYFVSGDIRTSELYPEKPFLVYYDTLGTHIPFGIPFMVTISDGKYKVTSENKRYAEILNNTFIPEGEYINVDSFSFTVRSNPAFHFSNDFTYSFIINDLVQMVKEYKGRININWADESSALIDFSCQSIIPKKDRDFFDAFLESVESNTRIEKYESARNAIRFLDAQAERLRDTLFFIDTKIDRLRLRNKKAVRGTDAVFAELDSLESIDAKLVLENRYYDFVKLYVDSTKPQDVFAPNMIGAGDELLNGFIKEYIQLKFDSRLYKSNKNVDNPLIKLQDRKAKRLEENIYENLANLKFKNDARRNDITKQISHLHESIPGLQIVSNEVKELLRFSKMYETLLALIQEKKLEAELSIAQTTSDYETVDSAKISSIPVAPDRKSNLLTWLFLGLAIPAFVIIALTYFNPRVTSTDDITEVLSFPIISTVWHNKSGDKIVVVNNPSSMISESFRSIRAKLKYYLDPAKSSHVILVTSSLSGEGKSFTSVNLGSMYALSGQKTILIGADLRKPSLKQYFVSSSHRGLSNYLAGEVELNEIINFSEIDNYYYIHAGELPPNPFELLSSNRMKELIDLLKIDFEKIIIDTPPLLLVSDSLPLAELSDVNLLLIRHNKTMKPSLRDVADLYEGQQVNNFTIIYNDVLPSKIGYGYGYGYGYGDGYYQ